MKNVRRQKNIPKDWEIKKLGEISQSVMYGMNSAAGEFDGVNKYIRITDINEHTHKFVPSPLVSPIDKVEDKYKLRKNDLLFARTGASVGKSYLFDENDGNIYFAGFLIKFNIFEGNASFIFNQTLLHKYWDWVSSMSVRSGQPGINAEEYKKLPVMFPPLPEQNRIVAVLETWDKAIEKLQQKIKVKKEIKKGLMQDLLTGDKRLKGFSGKWKNIEIREIFSYEQPTEYIVNHTDYRQEYPIPVLTAGKTFILGYTNESKGIYKNLPVIIFDDFTTANKFVDFEFKVKSSAMKILKTKDNYDIRFMYEKMQMIRLQSGEHKRKYLSEYQYIVVSVPDIKEQKEISKIIEVSDKEIIALSSKLKYLQDQKKYLLNNLITGQIRTPENLLEKVK